MENPKFSSNGKGLKMESDDSLSNSDSSPSREDNADQKWAGEGSSSSADFRYRSLTAVEIMEMQFVSEDEAFKFYNAYAKAMGFSIRKFKSKPLKGDKMNVRCRAWVCSREGRRDPKHLERVDRRRHHRSESRVGCCAKFLVRFMKDTGKYIVTHFVGEHTHDLARKHCVPFLRSHRLVNDADTAQATAMWKVGVKQGQILDYMTCGGFGNLGFTARDLRNKLDKCRNEEIQNGDAEGALGYLSAQVNTDPSFFFKYSVDEDQRLERLFWADGRSRLDYAAFGDVLVFDTTYRTIAYKKPFVILAGVSNHFMITIFGCALLSNETEETYSWVLTVLLEAMNGKRPISVITDGDLAMRNAVRKLLPDARHRLCSWHVERNAAKNVHIPDFLSDFTTLMQYECEVEEFKTLWADMVSHYGLESNYWLSYMYLDRERWAESYHVGHFYAGMRSTQRCESINRYLNRFLTTRLRLYEFVDHYHRGLARMRVADAQADTETENGTPVLVTQMKALEKNGAELYTKNMFRNFQDEIQRSTAFVVSRCVKEVDRSLYFIEKYSRPESKWTVEYYPLDSRMACTCLMFESFGLPCCHMILVMKHEHLCAIPSGLVMLRWTRRARPDSQLPHIESSRSDMTRYGILSSGYNLMSFYASHAPDSFEDARQVQHQLTSWMRKRCEMSKKQGEAYETGEASNVPGLFGVGDPPVVKTKGNPGNKNSTSASSRKVRKCRNCKFPGHDKRTCPRLSRNVPMG